MWKMDRTEFANLNRLKPRPPADQTWMHIQAHLHRRNTRETRMNSSTASAKRQPKDKIEHTPHHHQIEESYHIHMGLLAGTEQPDLPLPWIPFEMDIKLVKEVVR